MKDKLLETGFEQIGIISLPKDLTLPHLDVLCNVVGRRTFLAARFLRHVPVKVLSSHDPYFEMLPNYIARHGYHIIYLPVNNDPLAYTNFINIDSKTILASASATAIREILYDCDVNIQTVEISELEKGGGGIRCLTLPLFRAD